MLNSYKQHLNKPLIGIFNLNFVRRGRILDGMVALDSLKGRNGIIVSGGPDFNKLFANLKLKRQQNKGVQLKVTAYKCSKL